MFWALASGEIDTRDFEFEHVLKDIQTLNEWALEGRLEVTALSLHAYPFVQDRYLLLPHGASMGSGYGPIVVLRMAIGDFRYRVVAFDEIIGEVVAGRADAGLLIHEGQLTYESEGLV